MKKKKLIRKILWTTLFGALEIGILLLSNYLLSKDWLKNGFNIALTMLIFFVLSFIIEAVEDKS